MKLFLTVYYSMVERFIKHKKLRWFDIFELYSICARIVPIKNAIRASIPTVGGGGGIFGDAILTSLFLLYSTLNRLRHDNKCELS